MRIKVDNIPKHEMKRRFTMFRRVLSQNSHEFCRNTTLQGLKYVVNQDLYPLERVFFALWFTGVVSVSIFFILNVYSKWSNTPVIFSIDPEPTYISTEPFPAVTICNVNQADKSKVSKYSVNSAEYAMLQMLCKRNVNVTVADSITDWSNISKFIANIAQPCSQMLLACRFGAVEYNCSEIFQTIVTDEGLCCVFNMVHPSFMYTSGTLLDYNFTNSHGFAPVDWTVENGYPNNMPPKFYPRTSVGTGDTLGLSLTLDVESENYYCSSMNNVGFKILLHSPTELPSMREIGLLLSPGLETNVRIEADKVVSSPNLRSFNVLARQCLFQDEIKPIFFSRYSQRNCEIETVAKMLLKYCGCISHFMPRLYGNETVCSIYDAVCVESVRIKSMLTDVNDTNKYDDCLPSCFDLSFKPDFTSAPLAHNAFQVNGIVRNMSSEYVQRNIAIVHMCFKENTFRSNKQSEFIGMTDFLSSIGGLLGLFFGFSFVSIAELIFFGIIRPTRAVRQAKRIEQGNVSTVKVLDKNSFSTRQPTFMKRRFRTTVQKHLGNGVLFPEHLGIYQTKFTTEQANLSREFFKSVTEAMERQRRELTEVGTHSKLRF